MAYMGNRWGAPPPKPKNTTKLITYTEKKEFDNFADSVRHDLVKIVDFINKEIEPEINRMRTNLDEAMGRTDMFARHVYELQHDVRELCEKENCASAPMKRRIVTVRAGGKEVRIERV